MPKVILARNTAMVSWVELEIEIGRFSKGERINSSRYGAKFNGLGAAYCKTNGPRDDQLIGPVFSILPHSLLKGSQSSNVTHSNSALFSLVCIVSGPVSSFLYSS